jgi:hypothetical protein
MDIVDNWPHLGQIIYDISTDVVDILEGNNSSVEQINDVLSYFNYVDWAVELHLFKAYCSSLHGWRVAGFEPHLCYLLCGMEKGAVEINAKFA